MSPAQVRRALLALYVLGAAARVYSWWASPAIHPDEIYQALEPAWWRLDGVGLTTWEWRDGIRSWVLPGYNGAWMAALRAVGVSSAPALGNFLQLHWAAVNLLLIFAGFRGGAAVMRALAPGSDGALGGLIAAAGCALFPIVVAYAPHTLSELPSLLCLVLALVLAVEVPPPTRRRVLAIGALAGLGACIRIVNGPLALLPPLVLLVRGHRRALGWLLLGAAAPVLFFGLVDVFTWGRFLGSFIAYVEFNFIRGGAAANFGTEPWFWYAQRLFERAPLGLPLLLLAALAGLRGSWPFALAAVGFVALLSTQGHKEERFVVAFWPLLLIAAGGTLGALARRGRGLAAVAAIAALVPIADGTRHLEVRDLSFTRAWLDGQARAGRDRHVTGLMVESILFCGGTVFFGRRVAQFHFDPALLDNVMVSHALVRAGSDNERRCRAAGFVPVFAKDDAVLYKRP